jgi:hypothetical protein
MNTWRLDLRQKTFPLEFRINDPGGEDWVVALASAVSEAMALGPAKSSDARRSEAKRPGELQSAVNEGFAVALCNHHFRLRRNAEQLAADGGDSKELRSIRRALESLSEVFARYGIECRDVTGQTFDFLRLDFDPIGEAEPISGLNEQRIYRSECPAVLINGRLVQKARGIVAKPA